MRKTRVERVLLRGRAGPGGAILTDGGVPHLPARCDADPARHAAVDLEHGLDAVAAEDRRLVKRLCLVADPAHGAGVIHEDHVERDQRVLHPEADPLRARIDEQHAGGGGERLAVHQALRAPGLGVGDLDAERGLAAIGPAQIRHVLAAGPGQCRAARKDQGNRPDQPLQSPERIAASHPHTSIAIRPLLPSITRMASASPGWTSARPERRRTSMCRNTSSALPKVLAMPNPFPLSNHLTRAGSSAAARNSASPTSCRSARPVPSGSSGGSIAWTCTAWRPRAVRCTSSSTPARSATELWPKLRSTLACSRMSGPPSSASTKPNPLTGSNHFTRPLTRRISLSSVVTVVLPNSLHPQDCFHRCVIL